MDKHYIIYKTTNLLNGKFYIGMHVTSNIDDGYLGSGRRIKAEIKKYGRENFKREVLETCTSKEELAAREAAIVTEELRADSLCLNLKNGGEGGSVIGWNYLSKEKRSELGRRGGEALRRTGNSSFNRPEIHERGVVSRSKNNGGYNTHWNGRRHSDETLLKMKLKKIDHGVGTANSQFGTCWVTNGTAIKIKKEDLGAYLQNGYRQGRK